MDDSELDWLTNGPPYVNKDFGYLPAHTRPRRIQTPHTTSDSSKMSIIVANAPVPIVKERPYIVAPLDEIQNGKIQIPQKFFQNVEEASRHAAHLTRQDRPYYVLKIVSKVEMAPPPVVTTSFED